MSSQLRKEAVGRRDGTLKHGAFLLKEDVRQEWKRTIHSWKSPTEEGNMLTARD